MTATAGKRFQQAGFGSFVEVARSFASAAARVMARSCIREEPGRAAC